MMTNLMTILERKVFISSNPRIVLSSCPPPCGHFSIQESAAGGLSYKVKKNPAGQDSPPAAGRFSDIYLSAAVQSCPAGLFYATGDSNGISYCIRKTLENTEFSRVLRFLLKICRYQITYPSVLPTFIYCFLKCPFYKAFYAFLNSALPFYPISLWVETFHSR